MVTCGTYLKRHHLKSQKRLDLVQNHLFALAGEFGWRLQAWAVLSNHYHFVASSPEDPKSLSVFLSKLHTLTAVQLNEWDASPGRKVWYQYFDTHITYQSSYFARLNYVHRNAVHHGVTQNAEDYRWCSAAWFAEYARPAFLKTVCGFKVDRVNVRDDFEVTCAEDEEKESGVKPPHSGMHPQ